MRRHLSSIVCLVALCGAALAVVSPSIAQSEKPTWYWTPALCKSNLQSYGMQINDGRTFNVAKAFCVGWGGTQWCEWSSNYQYRLYGAFTAYARSYDGVVRQFNLYTVSKTNYRAEKIVALAVNVSADRFNAVVGPYAAAQAYRQHQLGCANYSP